MDLNDKLYNVAASAETTKALQTVTPMTGTLVPETPVVTTVHYYPHAPTFVQISQTEPAHCRSQVKNIEMYLRRMKLFRFRESR